MSDRFGTALRPALGAIAALGAIFVGSIVAGRISQSYCLRVTFYHAAAAVEDGLLWIEIPLGRRTRGRPSRAAAVDLFRLNSTHGSSTFPNLWKSGPRYLPPTRDLIRETKRQGRSTVLVAGFGWYQEPAYAYAAVNGPPVAKLRIVAPIWFALFAGFATSGGLYHYRRFGIRFLMVATAIVAAALWFLAVPVR